MSRLEWDQVGEKLYETGVDRGVLFPQEASGAYAAGAPWNGLTAVNESPEGAEPTPLYANNRKYLDLMSAEDFKGNIEAYTYPEEFEPCNGVVAVGPGAYVTQQKRKTFGFSYRSQIGNDTVGTAYGYKIHLVYNCLASPSEKENNTINDDPEAATMSWEFSTTPMEIEGYEPTAHLIVDSTKVDPAKLKALEDILYGTAEAEARLPLPEEFVELMGGEVENGGASNY